ncbi:hypothetical protein HOU08_gp002 [Dickeya phage vB_DsoM_JA29]|uniref:Uncharacterized protein n=1 Tax=Dickeya phage vB_DsoM_JA29 TaxID=2283031 RepID=A0A384ZWU8_9CAUD|nr:hypothetical protein HOU08_gp002 [Dickeya phage vB_DsoM_JA29]AXG66728.1 hypothetical protein JA29_002 [Dickeya phage vB_DsoM_JA29]
MLGDMSNTVSPVRLTRGIHKIHNQDFDYDGTDEIDLDETADAIQKTESRLLIRPELRGIRNRSKKNGIGAENVIEVSDDQVSDIIDHVEEKADSFRSMLLRRTVPLLLGYDIAAGESEAIVRDILKTDIEIDDELVGYIGRVTLADMIGESMKSCDNLPESVRADVLKDWLIKAFDGVRADHSRANKSSLVRRLKNEYEGMIANGKVPLIGTSRGLSQRHGKET